MVSSALPEAIQSLFHLDMQKRANSPFLTFHSQESLHLLIPEEPKSGGRKKDRFSFPVFFSQLTQKKGAPQFRTQEPFLEDFHFTASDSDTSGEAAN